MFSCLWWPEFVLRCVSYPLVIKGLLLVLLALYYFKYIISFSFLRLIKSQKLFAVFENNDNYLWTSIVCAFEVQILKMHNTMPFCKLHIICLNILYVAL